MKEFASQSITEHILRGVVAVALLVFAFQNNTSAPILSVAAGVGALIALRGCPICWTVGLFETVRSRLLEKTEVR